MKVVKMSAYISDKHLTKIINNDPLRNSFSVSAKISVRAILKKEREQKQETTNQLIF